MNNEQYLLQVMFSAIRAKAESLLRESRGFELHATNGNAIQRRAEAVQVREIEARARAAEERVFKARVKAEILELRVKELEAAESKRRFSDAEAAVEKMIRDGRLDAGNEALKLEYQARLIADPSLIRFVVGKTFNARRR